MKKFLLALTVVGALLGLTTEVEAGNCVNKAGAVVNCGTLVPDVDYGNGGKVVKTVRATACFEPQTGYDITLKNGYVEFVAAFVYRNERNHERIKDVRLRVQQRGDRVCWSHNVAPGTHMAVWVTCRTPDGRPYEGWVAVKITGPGTYTMVFRPDWNWRPSWL